MEGTIINVVAILVGGALGLFLSGRLSHRAELRIKGILALLVLYAGASLIWQSLNGPFLRVVTQLLVVMFSLVAGNLIGRGLRIQQNINKLGGYARERFAAAAENKLDGRFSEGFVTCSILFCVGPMALLGAVEDGLGTSFKILAIKSVMDGFAAMAFSRTFGWGVLISALPVLAYQGTITLLASGIEPYLQRQELVDSIYCTGGFVVLCLTLIVLDFKNVPVANYLPALVVAPLLTWLMN